MVKRTVDANYSNFWETFLQRTLRLVVLSIFFVFQSFLWHEAISQTVTQTFTANGPFTVPAGVTSITVECWGGGGGGGNASTNNTGNAGGGGGGAYARSVLTVTPGTGYAVVVGLGGTAGINGGNSTFNINSVVAAGGSGVAADANAGGAGGTVAASVGTIRYRGGNGGTATDAASPIGISGGGGGGAGSTGNGGDASGLTAGTGTANSGGNGGAGWTGAAENDGVNGSTCGGGGSGAHCTDNSNHAGGTGARGQVIVTFTQPIFYSQGSVTPNTLANWNTNPAGGGYSPTNFAAANQTFVIQTGHTMTTTAAWNISGANSVLRISNGGALTENNAVTLAATGTLQIDNGGTLNHNVNSVTIFSGTEVFGATSTVNYGFAGAQSVISAAYGNLSVSGGNIKTISGDISVSNNLHLNNGNLSLGSGSSNLTLGDGATVTATGSFNNSHMIICDGNGNVIRQSATAAGFIMIYPLGTNGFYTPLEITSLSATIGGTGSLSLGVEGTLAPGPPPANATDLARHWTIASSGLSAITASLSFIYNDADISGGDENIYEPASFTTDWFTPAGSVNAATNTIIVTGTTYLDAQWTAREPVYTYYSYQSGNWNVATTWTTDPSGTLSVNPSVPGADDRVVILNGRTVTTTANGYSVMSTQINEGGVLDIGTTNGHDFGDVRGQGWIKLRTGDFPGGNYTEFVAANGGTVEYSNAAGFNFEQLVYNNLILNLTSSAFIAVVRGNMTINNDLTINSGAFQVNDDALTIDLTIDITGDVLIGSAGSIATGNGNVGTGAADGHKMIINGDFTNNGTARFSDLAAPDYITRPNRRIEVIFNNPAADQDVIINGLTQFYRIEIDKGFDQTYVLNIDATATNLFYLFGYNNGLGSGDVATVDNVLALGLKAGTVRLGANITLPSLVEENPEGDLNYLVDDDACLWIDGASVTHTSHTYGTSNSFVLYGKLKITNPASSFNVNDEHGIILRRSGAIEVSDGTLTTPCIRTSTAAGTHRGSLNISGGLVRITGNLNGSDAHASLSMTYPGMSFNMSGGQLTIDQATNGADVGADRSLTIGADVANCLVTGGTVTLNIANRNANFTSTAPFWNLVINSPNTTYNSQIVNFTGGSGSTAVAANPLVVLNDFSLTNSAIFVANNQNVTIGGDFTMAAGSRYTPGDNTTTFNGTAGQSFANNGTITTGLYNLTITNTSNTSISQNLTLRNDLTIDENCFLQDMSHSINVAGDIVNSGTHTSQAGGGIILNATVNQTIGGSGSGVFGNLIINKTGGTASFTANQSLSGNLRLASGLLDISTYRLILGAGSNVYDALYPATTTVFSGTKMIRTAGNMSDGGVSKEFSSTASTFLFPIGTASDYTWARIQVNSAAAWGTVNIKPVTQYQPFVTSTNSLNYYWKVTQTGFSGLGTVSHTYHYVDADLVGRGDVNDYIPGVYNPFSWMYINDPAQVTSNNIQFSNVSYLEGDYTAGELDAFQNVGVYYSCTTGDWDDLTTWSTTSNTGPANATALPGPGNAVIIGDGASNNHVVTIPAGFNNIVIGGLQINASSTLDITTTTGHNFGAIPDSKITGTGLLKISSAVATAAFPGGDFGNFLTAGGGTVEYYSTAAQDFTLPVGKTYYNNLVISPTAGRFISMPNINMTVYGNYTVSGSDVTGVARLNTTAARTLIVEGDVNITGGTLQYYNGTAQTVFANNDINISNGAVFNVRNGGTAVTNLLYINGSLNNSGTFDMYTSATLFGNVSFTGDENEVISGTGTNDFNILTIDKGNSRNTILDVTANNLTLSYTGGTALILNNGTFRVSNSLLVFTLSTSMSFTIPITAALSVNQGSVTIGTNDNAGDLILAGRLEVINNGIVNIGNGSNFNNDIEYASGGNPEIILSGNAQLNVTGQIRRPLLISAGSLNYNQSGNSNLVIQGRQASNTRGMLEIMNAGSSFNMSGGSLFIYRNYNSTSNYELYLAPEASTVTGGRILIGSSAVTSGTAFNIVSAVPLWEIIVYHTATSKTVNQRIYPLTIQNNLTIQGNNDYRANGLDVTIEGSLINSNGNAGTGVSTGGYQPGSSSQITTFNGSGAQLITGAGGNLTNFANLVVETGSSLTLSASSNIRVNANLTMTSGTFNDGGNTITVMGNIENGAVHNSPITSGGIYLNGALKQTISGSGTGQFGNIIIDNSLGIDMVDNSIINGQLTFSNGNLYIDDYMLTFGTNAAIGGTPNADNMIMMNGVVSDQGVKKLYPSGASDFTFPIGVAGKYTPARYNVTANGAAGSILIRPVNYKHPSTYENPAATNELQYYWYAVSTGFSGLTVSHEYHYDGGDALPDETNYVVGRYSPVSFTWEVPAEGTVYAASDYFDLAGVNYIYGEYTCGVNIAPSPNFQDLPIYYSRNATSGGNWTDPNAWTLNADGSGGPAPSYPQGNAVVILAGHTITLNANSQTAYSVNINGTLAVGTTLYHSLGHIRGGGRINLTSTVSGSFIFPAGVYDEFMANTSSTIEFYNNSAVPATLPLKPGNDYKPYQNVIFSGSGVKYMSAENMRVLGNLTIEGGTLNNTLHNKTLTILGNWTDNTTAATGGFVPGTGKVVFNGSATQSLNVTNGTTKEQFYHLQINNAAGLTLDGSGQVAVNRNLYLTLGNINTDAVNLLSLTYASTSAVVGGGSSSFVNGPLQKRINSGSYFDFPIGNGSGTRYGNLYLSTATATGDYLAQYYNHNPGIDSYNPDNVVNPIDAVSNIEYWRLNGPAATANIRIRWDSQSGIIPADAASRQKLRIVEWNGSAWQNSGNVIVDNGLNSGTIQTSPVVSVSGNHYFTIGAESLPTANITSSDSSICDDGSTTGISIELTGTSPWTIRYRVNGGNETTVNNIASSPYILAVSNTIEPLATQGPGDYVFNVSYIRDATGSTGIRDFTSTVTITLNESPNPVISGNSTVGIGEIGVVYTSGAANIPGHTYLWEVSAGASIASGQGTYRITVDWPSVSGSGYVLLTETVTDGGCYVTTLQYDVEITDIPNPLVTGPTPTCLNETFTYRTASVGTHTYLWTLPSGGGTIVGSTALDSVVVTWTSTGIRTVQVAETGSSTVTDDLLVTVNPVPSNANSVSDPAICNGETASIIINAAAAGISYQLYRISDDAIVGGPVSSGPGGNVTLTAAPSANTDYYVIGTNEYTCSSQLTDISSVTVHPLPVPALSGQQEVCTGAVMTYTTDNGGGISGYTWSISNGTFTGGNTYQIEVTWSTITGDYEDHTVNVNYADGNGCEAASPTELTIRIYRTPVTGPQHHINNLWNN
jgi:hypothetical protein